MYHIEVGFGRAQNIVVRGQIRLCKLRARTATFISDAPQVNGYIDQLEENNLVDIGRVERNCGGDCYPFHA